MKREFRILPHAEIRAKSGDKPGIEGYAAVFNVLSEDLGWFREIIMPGAFTDCLKSDPDVRCLFNHDSNLVLGRTKANTLSLEEDSKGLHFDCDMPATQAARDLLTSISRGDIDQCSFGFYVKKQKWAEEEDKNGVMQLIREIHAVELFDVSPVTFPAYPQTSVDKRSLWPDGLPHSVRLAAAMRVAEDEESDGEQCKCDCPECEDGDHANCSNEACNDPNCDHGARKLRILPADSDDQIRERMRMQLMLAD